MGIIALPPIKSRKGPIGSIDAALKARWRVRNKVNEVAPTPLGTTNSAGSVEMPGRTTAPPERRRSEELPLWQELGRRAKSQMRSQPHDPSQAIAALSRQRWSNRATGYRLRRSAVASRRYRRGEQFRTLADIERLRTRARKLQENGQSWSGSGRRVALVGVLHRSASAISDSRAASPSPPTADNPRKPRHQASIGGIPMR